MKEHACRKCRRLTTESKCPSDGSKDLSNDWSGLIVILDAARSEVARALGITTPGRYAFSVL
jgi:DNA-directed RNA polymerase subunit E"